MTENEVPKTLAFVLVILTVLISAASTWVLIDLTMDTTGQPSGIEATMIRLHILRGPVEEPMQTDTNSGNVKLYVSKGGQ